jgi:hypothetical protein
MTSPQLLFQVSEGLEAPIQLIYLLSLLGFLSVGAYLVVRQVRCLAGRSKAGRTAECVCFCSIGGVNKGPGVDLRICACVCVSARVRMRACMCCTCSAREGADGWRRFFAREPRASACSFPHAAASAADTKRAGNSSMVAVAPQVLIRRELDEAAKALGERIRTGQASCEVRPRSLTARPGTGLSSSRRPRLALALSGGVGPPCAMTGWGATLSRCQALQLPWSHYGSPAGYL